jgi:ubiquinone/menaquinone biosynthesis C-methylase UbiE
MESKEYFNEVAAQWDSMREGFFSESIREKAYDIAKVEKAKLAADIGAGTGFVTEGLLHRGLSVIAVDSSNEMLEQMKKKYNGSNMIDYRQGKSEKLPIDSDTVDYAMANMYLHHVLDPFVAIKEMVRILKIGGKLVITDLDEHNFEFLRTEHHDRWMGFKRENVNKWFTEAGLKSVIVDCAGGNCSSISNRGCVKANISIFVAYGEK